MRTSHAVNILFLLILFSLPSCRTKQDGAVEGAVTPPGSGARISAAQSGKTVSTIDAGIQDGKFRITLPAGTYDVGITSPSSPFPLNFPGITVESGKTTTLPLIELTPPSGTAAL